MTNNRLTSGLPPSLFRQSAIDCAFSPERLDTLLPVAPLSSWAVLLGIFVLFAAAAFWSWNGTVTSTAKGQGILISAGGVVAIAAPSSGQIAEFPWKPGDVIRAKQVITRIGNPVLAEQLKSAEKALAEAKQDQDRSQKFRADTVRLQGAALERQLANLHREMAEIQNQICFAREALSQQEQLFAAKLIIRAPVIAAGQKITDLEADVARHQAQLEQLAAEWSVSQAGVQDQAAQSLAHIEQLQSAVSSLREQLQQTTVVTSAYGGEIVEVKTYAGATIGQGTAMLTIQPQKRSLEALIYVPSAQAKLVVPGMQVQLSPSNARPEEHGYLAGVAAEVASFPVTNAALMRRVENDSLTSALTGSGPVTEIRIVLVPDAEGHGGYRWSSRTALPVTLSSGTLCTALIVTKRQRPLSLLIPFVREELGSK